ncbi:hypothetical protein [Spirosoma foliorum]|uniref:Uncharacterized protein n=1 Tax=Spirosoma foliorum TaxID=2710596 RepID=A0A7G5GVG5_9BACT|nr:hypothetical protein [Spirosoma foliorum]QMW02857.1 hypothetical protein H3H32_34030 [Spirosoma foliorum]
MITEAKLNVYKDYRGDGDFWARIGLKRDKAIMEDGDFYLIDSLLQDIELVKRGLVSEKFAETVDKKLLANCDNAETIVLLKSMARKE